MTEEQRDSLLIEMSENILLLATTLIMATNTLCFAGSGNVSVHWEGSSREATYTYAKKHCEAMGYSVENCNNWDNNQVLNQLKRDKIFLFLKRFVLFCL